MKVVDPQCQPPFAVSSEEVLQRRGEEVQKDVAALRQHLHALRSGRSMRLAEVRCLMQDAEALKGKLLLPAPQLDRLNWPRKELAELQELLQLLDHWDELCGDVRRRLMSTGDGGLGGPALLKALAETWQKLSQSEALQLELQDRAGAARGLACALADRLGTAAETMPGLRQSLDAVLADPALRPSLRQLDVPLPGGRGAEPSMAEAFAPTEVYKPTEAAHGLSGQSHRATELASALRAGETQLALNLWRSWAGGDGEGVDLATELLADGDSPLHALSRLKKFDHSGAELFTLLLRASGPASLRQRNSSGQTFLHAAAGRLNGRILAQALTEAPELAPLFVQKDAAGHSPMSILAKHVFPRGAGAWHEELPALKAHGASGSDVNLEVEDEATGRMESLSCKSSVLRLSPRFSEELRVQTSAATLKVAPECCRSARVVTEVLAMLQSGEPSVELDGRELWQFLSFCVQYQLPADLKHWASERLLRCLKEGAGNAAVVPMLLRGARACGLTMPQRRYVLHCMLTIPEALTSAGHSEKGVQRQAKVLLAALAELECLKPHGHHEHRAAPGTLGECGTKPKRAMDVALEGQRLRSEGSR